MYDICVLVVLESPTPLHATRTPLSTRTRTDRSLIDRKHYPPIVRLAAVQRRPVHKQSARSYGGKASPALLRLYEFHSRHASQWLA